MSEYTVPEDEAWRFELPDQCPHCPEGVTIRRSLLDDHIAEAHADLPPCTARISNAGTGDQTVRCRFRVGHRDDSGGHHAGPYDERMGRLRWGDHAMGAVPHRQSDDTGRRCPRCDCSDGHTQCDHCKVCPHVRTAIRQRPLRAEVRACGVLAAMSWLIAVAATIDWFSGNPTAPTGIITFAVTGALFAWLALYLNRSDKGAP